MDNATTRETKTGDGGGDSAKAEDLVWAQLAFPFYMQNAQDNSAPVKEEAGTNSSDPMERGKAVWETIRCGDECGNAFAVFARPERDGGMARWRRRQ